MKGKESKCAAVRLEKSRLMAAMAILAVAFVVLAAVPAVMTESDATDQTVVKDLAAGEELTTGYWYYVSGTGNTITIGNANGANLILKAGVTVTITTGDANIYTGTLSGTTATYNSDTLVSVTGNTDATITAAENGTSYALGTALMTVTEGVIYKAEGSATDATLYPLAKFTAKSLANTDVLEIYIPAANESTKSLDATVSSTPSTGSAANVINLALTQPTVSDGPTDLKITAGEDEALTVAKASSAANWAGVLKMDRGKASVPDSGAKVPMQGIIDNQTSKTLYAVDTEVDLGTINAASVIFKILNGTTVSKDTGVVAKGTEESATNATFWTLLAGFKAKTDLTLTFAGGEVTTPISTSTLSGSTTVLGWDGVIQADSLKCVFGAVGLGSAKIAAEPSGSSYVTITGGVVAAGSVVTISGKTLKNATDGGITLAGSAAKTTSLTIASGAEVLLNSPGTIKVAEYATLIIKGTLSTDRTDGSDDVVKNTSKGAVDVQAGATITGINFASDLTVTIDESVMNEKRESGEVSTGKTVYPVNQIVVIDGTWTLMPGAEVTINGKLSVPEGAKVIVGEGAKLILDGSATAEIEGSIEISEASSTVPTAGILEIKNGTAKIYGDAVVNGTLVINEARATVEVEQDAILTIGDEGILDWDATGQIIVDASGTLVMNGGFQGAATILNYGLVTIDSEVPSDDDQTVKLMANGAIVDVVKFTVDAGDIETLIITDLGLQAASYKESGETKYVTIEKTDGSENSKANKIVITPGQSGITGAVAGVYLSVTGLQVTSAVTSETTRLSNDTDAGIYNKKIYTKTIDISGSVDASYEKTDASTATIASNAYASAGVVLTNGYVTGTSGFAQVGFKVTDSVSIADNITMTNSTGKLSVTGTIATASKDADFAAASGAITEVSGNGAITTVGQTIQTSEAGVSAAKYETSVKDSAGATVKTYHYVSIDAAIAAADGTNVKEIIVLGTQTVKTTAALAPGVALNGQNSAVLNIGTSKSTDVVLTISEGASVKGSMEIDVFGTLFAENKKDVKIASSVVSDVYSEEIGEDGKAVKEGWAQWTNLAAALASGVGQTITISKTDDYVEIKSNLTIPAGTTVVVPDDKAQLKLFDGVTLTIDGALQTSKDIVAETRFAVNAMDISGTAESSAVVVNGVLMVADSLPMTIGSGYASSTTAKSFLASAPVYGAYYTIQDWKVVTTIDQALTETDITSAAITVYGPVVGSDGTVTANDTFKGITVSATEFTPVNNEAKVETSLTMTSLTLGKGTSITMTGPYTGSVVVGENSVQFTDVSGTINAANSSDALVLTGSTTLVYTKALTISAGTVSLGTSSVAFDYVDSDSYSPMYIASGATAKVVKVTDIDNLSVSGTLEVPAGKTLTVGTLTVYGSVSTAASTDTTAAGSLTVGTAYVGITEYDFYEYSTGASASVAGPLSVTKMFVVSGATVDQDLSGYKKTEVYNNGSLWFTAYGKDSTQTMKLNKAPLSNAVLSGWATSEGGDVYYKTTSSIYIGADTALYSVVNTQIYTVIIKADTGIGDLYLNGNIMQKGTISTTEGYAYTAFWATVSYGTYEVTCKLANGYSGTAVLKDSTGATVSANKFTTSDATDYTTENFQLTGIEKSGYVQPTEEKDDSGLTVTDYLLIVLVILVVVLAVIVALRLMRS